VLAAFRAAVDLTTALSPRYSGSISATEKLTSRSGHSIVLPPSAATTFTRAAVRPASARRGATRRRKLSIRETGKETSTLRSSKRTTRRG